MFTTPGSAARDARQGIAEPVNGAKTASGDVAGSDSATSSRSGDPVETTGISRGDGEIERDSVESASHGWTSFEEAGERAARARASSDFGTRI